MITVSLVFRLTVILYNLASSSCVDLELCGSFFLPKLCWVLDKKSMLRLPVVLLPSCRHTPTRMRYVDLTMVHKCQWFTSVNGYFS